MPLPIAVPLGLALTHSRGVHLFYAGRRRRSRPGDAPGLVAIWLAGLTQLVPWGLLAGTGPAVTIDKASAAAAAFFFNSILRRFTLFVPVAL